MRILVVEDDECVANALQKVLASEYYVVDIAPDGLVAWELIKAFSYDLILLDIMLPKLDGIKLCQELRLHKYEIPILLLTAQNSNTHKVMGLDAGADDYVVKPFEVSELLARIRVLLRRRSLPIQSVLEWGKLRLDLGKCEVTYNGYLLNLTPKEYRLLELFLRNTNIVFSRTEILEHLWAIEEAPQEDTVTAHIKGLRQKLKQAGSASDFIETVYGLGYRLKASTGHKNLKKSNDLYHRATQTSSTKNSESIPRLTTSSNREHAVATGTRSSLLQTSSSIQESYIQQTQAALTEVWEKLRFKTIERIKIIEQATNALKENTLTEELRQKSLQAAHKLAGSLGIFGFTEGSRLAEQIQEILTMGTRNKQSEVLRLSELIEFLRSELKQPAFKQFDKVVLDLVLDDGTE